MVFVLGNDACGKEDICAKLAAEVGGSYLSSNALLRSAVESSSEEGGKLAEMIKQGKIVPASTTTQLLIKAMADSAAPYLVDGFPKSLDNLATFEEQVGACKLALLFEMSDELAKERMAAQGKEEELIQRKLRNFTTQTMPIAQALEGRSLLRKVSAADASAALQEALKHLRALTGGGGEPSGAQPTGAPPAAPPVSAPIIFCVGGPGSGKTTLCKRLADKFPGLTYLSAGDLLRDEVKKASEPGRRIAEMIKEGKIVPTQVTIDLFKQALATGSGPFVVEGFPRSLDNLLTFEEQCGKCSALLFLNASDEAMERRCQERAKATGRSDDSAEHVARKTRTFKTQVMPVVEELGKRDVLSTVDANGSEDEVFERVCEAIKPFATG